MKTSITLLTKKLPGFNKRVFTEDDFWRISRRERIFVDFWPLPDGGKGFYGVNKLHRRTYRYIVIDSKLLHDRWLPTAFHELIHHFLHVPSGRLEVYFSKAGQNKRHEKEADMFSLMMRIPLPVLTELMTTSFDDMPHLFTAAEMKARLRLYERYGI